ncbi:hypothetical protein ASPZODRAFT_452842 [Penicilliopsis zonata CBS 506.65]|uniref:DUF676 domain-containing protein n=1 Tax=Penicilliopsis zonata CBS 506.65 TaxID=1073090 RepID=A0A1L9SWZ7_9EURO|nr:hypothetical protein ASPZODRAFT_452842 [Penicilliopsis zonata CBS 506.65]OJJ51704.1 hypothetical protein ASPZODRAFT_452842 [Penicilliopsis zonata CBS 506.65]
METDVCAASTASGPPKADHLCVLVHGLWGNPSHLDYVASALRERHNEDRLVVLAVKRNAGTFTYDGIELGGERVAHEIEETLEKLASEGYKIKKLSVVGYSLGGLVARYALGLLGARGWLDKLEPVNFTTFVSPHVGVRTPLKGIQNHIWNVVGARTVSMSGRQLFMIDTFRDTGKPLLSVLADPESIFMQALSKFKNRCAYGNIVNDLSTVFYTTGITKFDPFRGDLDDIKFNYVKGYEPVIINPDQYILPVDETEDEPGFFAQTCQKFTKILGQLPFWTFITLFVPVAASLFLLNSVIQNFLSRQRIRLHETGKAGAIFGGYRVPLLVQNVQQAVEDVFENVNSRQDPAYLSDTNKKPGGRRASLRRVSMGKPMPNGGEEKGTAVASTEEAADEMGTSTTQEFPTLALTSAQLAIVDSLNALGFRKYPVYIHNNRHSHAAIIVRMPKKGFEEGKIVVKHWLDREFEV